MCKFFLMNKCGKGSSCAFAHGLTEIREKPNLEKTSMCKQFLEMGNCSNPRCYYAHDERELRTTTEFFKTKLCRFAASGRCKHGAACRFAHILEELPPSMAQSLRGSEQQQQRQQQQRQRQGRGGNGSTDTGNSIFNGDRRQSSFDGENSDPAGGGGRVARQQPTNDWAEMNSDQGSGTGGHPSSDQSTRAETSASVPTPEGSGDSGQEEFSEAHLQRRAGVGDERGRRRAGEPHRPFGRHCTTMMLTNVPNFLTQGALVSLLEDLTVSMRDAFDFFYCPWDPYQDRNLGYCIVNFFSRSVAADFATQWANQLLLPRTHGCKRLRIVPAALQGRRENLRHFSGFSLAHHNDPRFRPLVRASPNEPLRPMAISEELDARLRDENNNVTTTATPYPKELAQGIPSAPVPPPPAPFSNMGNLAAAGALEACRQQELLLSMFYQQHAQALNNAAPVGQAPEAEMGSSAAAAPVPSTRSKRADGQRPQRGELQQGQPAAPASWGAAPQNYLFVPQAPPAVPEATPWVPSRAQDRPGKEEVAGAGHPEMQMPQCWAIMLPQGANTGTTLVSPPIAGLEALGLPGDMEMRSIAGMPSIASYAANPYLQQLSQLSQWRTEEEAYSD